MSVYVNRMLNLKKIKLIGFDMDYTLVGYHAEAFERLTYDLSCKRLTGEYKYPGEVSTLKFDFKRAILGLVIDKRNGNVLQLSRHSKVKMAYHGLEEIDYRMRKNLYQNIAIDLSTPYFQSLDTSFAISYGVLFSQLVQLKKEGAALPDYYKLADDINQVIDSLHKDGSLKSVLKKNFSTYVKQDPKVASLLERYRDYGKKLMIITNSDYLYTRALLDYAVNPFLKQHEKWQDLFDIVITFADKPRFFELPSRFLSINPDNGQMSNFEGKLDKGVFQGGWFGKLQKDMNVQGNEILYLGDHIYGDVVSIKKRCDWRTGLVLGDLEEEIEAIHRSEDIQKEIDNLMERKGKLERKINQLDIEWHEGKRKKKPAIGHLFDETDILNARISELLVQNKSFFNPWWGEILRTGSEESRYAEQLERYACIYMTKVSDLYDYSPKTYFRPLKRIMPHEYV